MLDLVLDPWVIAGCIWDLFVDLRAEIHVADSFLEAWSSFSSHFVGGAHIYCLISSRRTFTPLRGPLKRLIYLPQPPILHDRPGIDSLIFSYFVFICVMCLSLSFLSTIVCSHVSFILTWLFWFVSQDLYSCVCLYLWSTIFIRVCLFIRPIINHFSRHVDHCFELRPKALNQNNDSCQKKAGAKIRYTRGPLRGVPSYILFSSLLFLLKKKQ